MVHFTLSFSPSSTQWMTHSMYDLPTGLPKNNPKQVVYGPGDLFGAAILTCFLETFRVIMNNSQVHFEKVSVESDLSEDKNEEGETWFSQITMNISISGVSSDQQEKARFIFEKAARHCHVMNSVKTKKVTNLQFV